MYHQGPACHTCAVPTTRPRHQVTETPALARALDAAARRWPGEPRSKLLLRLVEMAAAILDEREEHAERRRLEAVDDSSGKYADAFGPDYLRQLRRDWPE